MASIAESSHQKAVFAIFHLPNEIESAKGELRGSGFSKDSILTLHPPVEGSQDFSYSYKTSILSGAIYGAILGSITFFFVGLLFTARNSAIPGLDSPTSILDQITVLLLIVIGGGAFGAAAGALIGIGIPVGIRYRYGDYVDVGGYLMSVQVNSPEERSMAEKTMEKCGGLDIAFEEERKSWESVLSGVLKRHG